MALTSSAKWINHPQANSAAESKIHQLLVAGDAGFAIPRTLISNDAESIRRFHSQVRDVVVKALDAPLVRVNGQDAFMFTTHLRPEHLADEEALSASPMIFQERIAPRTDIRVTIVGQSVFAASAQHVTAQDWRLEQEPVPFESVALDTKTRTACVDVVRTLGLIYGAIDLVQRDHELFFLEVNPNGEWGWLQAAGMDIASAIADALT